MKEIKQERTRIEVYFEYEANDGTIFTKREECEEYEQTVECVVMTKYSKLVLSKDNTEYSLFGFGNDDDHIDLIKVCSQDDINVVMDAWLTYNYHYKSDEYRDRRIEKLEMLNKAMEEDDIIFVNHGYENDGFWFEGTRNQHIEVLKNLDKLINKEQPCKD